MPDEQLLTPEEVARRLQMRVRTVKRWLAEGTLKGVRPGGKIWRVRPADLEAFLAGKEDPGGSGPE